MTPESRERWHTSSHAFQMGSIYTEIARAHDREQRGESALRQGALERALDMLDATLEDPRWRPEPRLREIARIREFIAGHYLKSDDLPMTLAEIETSLYPFALQARS